MWKKFKDGYCKIIRDMPGERFVNFHHRWRQQVNSPGLTFALIVIGFILIGAGIALAFLPVAPGFVLLLPGIAMIAAPFRTPAEWLDQAEVWIRKIWRRFRRRSSPR